ncbi:MAG: tetratricopeptide repeat protein [Planctomycetes bacterium]|nr:tetratricopeptide repeat protein [Planctomycetota bacterium]
MDTKTRIDHLKKLHAADPKDDFCIYSLAQEYAGSNQLPEAITWFEKLLAEHPAHAYGYYHYAKALERCDRAKDALAALQRGLQEARKSGDAKAASELASYLDELTP